MEERGTPVQVVCRVASLPRIEHPVADGADALQTLHDATARRRVGMDVQRAPLFAAHIAADAHTGETVRSCC